MQESLQKKMVLGLLLRQSCQNGKLTGSRCGEVVTTLCLVKEEERALGDPDAEARHLVDEAKNLASVAFDISKMNR